MTLISMAIAACWQHFVVNVNGARAALHILLRISGAPKAFEVLRTKQGKLKLIT
jgi:hypothetical protein